MSPNGVSAVCDFLVEKLDALAATWRDERDPPDDGAAELQQSDLFHATPASGGGGDDAAQVIVPAPPWLRHLRERTMVDGAPRRERVATGGAGPDGTGLVLDWLFGSIINTAEKARENARRTLPHCPPPDVDSAWALLSQARPGHSRRTRCSAAARAAALPALVRRGQVRQRHPAGLAAAAAASAASE